jgi:hypothetical protein
MLLGQPPSLPGPDYRGHLIEQGHRENICALVFPALVEHGAGNSPNLAGQLVVAIDFNCQQLPAMRKNRPKPAGNCHHPGIGFFAPGHGGWVVADSVALSKTLFQVYASRHHSSSFFLLCGPSKENPFMALTPSLSLVDLIQGKGRTGNRRLLDKPFIVGLEQLEPFRNLIRRSSPSAGMNSGARRLLLAISPSPAMGAIGVKGT